MMNNKSKQKLNTIINQTIWVDADACPVVIREILFKASMRTGIAVTLVANQYINIPHHKHISMIQVGQGFDVADNEIVKRVNEDDLVITADIPLAAEVIDKGAQVLSPRGELLTLSNVKTRLSMRNFMEDLRTSGVNISGPAAMSQSDRHEFSKQLDSYLAKRQR